MQQRSELITRGFPDGAHVDITSRNSLCRGG